MFEVKRSEQKPVVVIRTATAHEFSNYEKWKLENIQEGAEVNKIEAIEVITPGGESVIASIDDKIAKLDLGEMALKDKITEVDISQKEIFMIECSLDV
jgi:hypothetical protein